MTERVVPRRRRRVSTRRLAEGTAVATVGAAFALAPAAADAWSTANFGPGCYAPGYVYAHSARAGHFMGAAMYAGSICNIGKDGSGISTAALRVWVDYAGTKKIQHSGIGGYISASWPGGGGLYKGYDKLRSVPSNIYSFRVDGGVKWS